MEMIYEIIIASLKVDENHCRVRIFLIIISKGERKLHHECRIKKSFILPPGPTDILPLSVDNTSTS